MFGLLDEHVDIQDRPDAPELMVEGGAVTFDDVHFPMVTGPSCKGCLSLCPRANGLPLSGQAGREDNHLRLLFRFYDPHKGVVRIDGQNLPRWRRAACGRPLVVPQDTVMFNATIG